MDTNITCTCTYNGRKNKIFQRNWGNTKNASLIFDDAREIFTNGRLEKILNDKARTKANSKFSKRDAIAYCIDTLSGKKENTSGNSVWVQVPLNDDIFMRMYRFVYSLGGAKLVTWTIDSIYEREKEANKFGWRRSKKLSDVGPEFKETLENFEKLRDIINLKPLIN